MKLIEKEKFDADLEFKNQLRISIGEQTLFLKREKYSYLNEYRIIWFSDNPVIDSIIVKCPDAIKYCESIYFK